MFKENDPRLPLPLPLVLVPRSTLCVSNFVVFGSEIGSEEIAMQRHRKKFDVVESILSAIPD
jgi:hypothetical protein